MASKSEPPVTAELARSKERLAIAALALAAFALNLNTNVLGALLPFVREDLTLTDRDATYLVSAAALGSALGALGAGLLADRHGRRAVLVGGLMAFVVFSLGHLLTKSLWPFLLLRGLSGVAVGVAYAAASALAGEVVPYARRGAAMGAFTAGMFLAIPVGMPLSSELARRGHWPAIFAVQAVVGVLGCWWAMRAVPPSPPTERRLPMRTVLANGAVRAGLLATMLHVGSFFTTVQLATTWLDKAGLVAKEEQMSLWVGLGALSFVGSAVFGRFSDRIGKRNFVLATSVVLVLCFLLLARGLPPLWLLSVGALLALTAAARTGPLQALVSGLVPKEQLGALMGLRGFVMQIGVFAFALAAGPVAAQFEFHGVLVFAAACQLVSYVVIRCWVREGR